MFQKAKPTAVTGYGSDGGKRDCKTLAEKMPAIFKLLLFGVRKKKTVFKFQP